ncbi:MAG TPA: TIGR03086 family metal-binding protein, partial [Acidimicrobiales bacterium]
MLTPDDLEKAFASTGAVLGGVTAEQMDLDTPCQSWKVRDLVNHIVGAAAHFGQCAELGHPPDSEDTTDYAAGAFEATFNDAAVATVEAFRAEGTLEKIIHLPFGDFPGAAYMNIATGDTFTHGWDLARAIGQPTDLDPALAAKILDTVRPMLPDAFR